MSSDQTERLNKLTPSEKAILLKASRGREAVFEKSGPISSQVVRSGLQLSFAQQRLWFFDRLVGNSPLYNIPFALRLCGKLSIEVMRRALTEIAGRHEILRTKFAPQGEKVVQIIDPPAEVALPLVELDDMEEHEREARARLLAREEAERPFDLALGPLWRATLLRLARHEHVALFSMHHAISDDWSIRLLITEAATLYEAYLRGEDPPLPRLEIQYADYAEWQRECFGKGIFQRDLEYWKENLKNAAALELPTDYVRPTAPSYRGAKEKVDLGSSLSEGLRRLSQHEGATVFMVLMAAFKVVLMRYSGEEDVIVGTAIANRARREIQGLIGLFANTLVMRTDLSGNPSFRELIKREREVALEAYGRQDTPFEKLVEEINPERDPSRNPLFQVMLVLENTRLEELELKELKIYEFEEETRVTKFDLTLILTEGKENIEGWLEYSLDLYRGETIERMARRFEKVVEEAVRDAGQRIREIELMGEAERRQIIEEWNETGREYRETPLLPEMIAAQASRRPEGVAVTCEQDQISYRELNQRATRLARYLRELGVGPEVIVGVCLERSVEMVVGLLGVLKAGGVYLPMDPAYPDQRLNLMVDSARLRILLTQSHQVERFEDQSVRLICLDRDWETISTRSSEDFRVQVEPDHPAYVIYTSGSTG